MSHVLVDNITNREGGAIGISSGAVVTGVVTATTGLTNTGGGGGGNGSGGAGAGGGSGIVLIAYPS